MNNLSWLIYLADVVPSFAGVLIFVGALGFVLWAARNAVAGIGSDGIPFEGVLSGRASAKYPFAFAMVSLFALAALIPSKETIYLIAGSEAGEAVVTSEQGQEILNDVQQVIKSQLQKLQDPTTSTE